MGHGTVLDRTPVPAKTGVTVTKPKPAAAGGVVVREAAPLGVRAARIAGWCVVVVLAALLAYAFPYYTAALARRVRNPLHEWLRPSGTIGQALGVLALGLFLFLWLYPLRKKLGRVPSLGSLPRWLDVHVVAGLLVPVVAAMHAGLRFHGLIGLGYGSMFVVCLSGIVGRYIYVHIPRSRSGVAMTLDETAAERRQALHDLATAIGRPVPEIESRLISPRPEVPTMNPLRILGRMLRDDLARRRAVSALARDLRRPGGRPLDRQRLAEAVRLARREMALSQQASMLDGVQRIFRWWHAAHRPFALTALVAVLLHVGVAVAMGQTWLR